MSDLARLLLLLGFAGLVVTLAGSAVIWFMEENRQIRRAMKKVLKGDPEALIVAPGRGRAAGFSFSTGLLAVAWDTGAWCLVYRIDELQGAEIIVDGAVVARAYRGEPRRPLDQAVDEAARVTLRLIFDDPANPDFELDLFAAVDAARRPDASPKAAVQEANRWMARAEAILRRPGLNAAPAIAPPPPPAPPPVAAAPAAPASPQRDLYVDDEDDEDDAPPWAADDEDDEPHVRH